MTALREVCKHGDKCKGYQWFKVYAKQDKALSSGILGFLSVTEAMPMKLIRRHIGSTILSTADGFAAALVLTLQFDIVCFTL